MARARLVALLAVWLVTPAAAEDERPGLDPHLWALASLDATRLVVERTCSPEHCFTAGRLEWLAQRESRLVVVHTTPIEELSPQVFVYSVAPDAVPDRPSFFRVFVVDRLSGKATTFEVEPADPGQYRVRRP